jgi:hypothetical protein
MWTIALTVMAGKRQLGKRRVMQKRAVTAYDPAVPL